MDHTLGEYSEKPTNNTMDTIHVLQDTKQICNQEVRAHTKKLTVFSQEKYLYAVPDYDHFLLFIQHLQARLIPADSTIPTHVKKLLLSAQHCNVEFDEPTRLISDMLSHQAIVLNPQHVVSCFAINQN